MKKKFLLPALLLLLPAGAADVHKPSAYSLELSEGLKPTEKIFPLGMLGGSRFTFLPQLGFNFTEIGHCCYSFKDTGKCSCSFPPNRSNGLYFVAIWAAHSMWYGGNTATHGPVIRPVDENGKAQEGPWIDYLAPTMRDYIRACVKASVEGSVNEKPKRNIMLWNIDNEWEPVLNYSPLAMAGFQRELEHIYGGDIGKLNEVWKTKYRSFCEILPPKGEEYLEKPAAWLAWHDYSENTFVDFIGSYLGWVREFDPEHRPAVLKSTQCSSIEMNYIVRSHMANLAKLADRTRRTSDGWIGIDMYGNTDRNAYETSYIYNCIRPTATQQAAGEPEGRIFFAETNNHAGPGFQFAATYWRTLAHGMRGVDFFVLGRYKSNWDNLTFSFIDGYDGQPRDRMFYASRWANMIHRSEEFWHDALPAKNVPKIAILMPQRDVLLSMETNRSRWDYSVNNRLNVFTRLRDAGYWVDVLPYTKLTDDYLARYRALILVSAEHLSAEECAAIRRFTANGGVVMADMMPGYYDEKHRVTQGLDELLGVRLEGVYSGIHFSPDDVWYGTEHGFLIRGDGRINVKLAGAELLNARDVACNAKSAWVTCNRYGKGRVYWFNTRIGVLRAENAPESDVTTFLTGFLKRAGVAPAYSAAQMENLRIEHPLTDGRGNWLLAAGVMNRLPWPGGKVTLKMPPEFKLPARVWFGAAEENMLHPIPAELRADGTLELTLPEIRSAGMIYLFNDHAPMLSLAVTNAERHAANDPNTPMFEPGKSCEVVVSPVDFSPGSEGRRIALDVEPGWKVTPVSQPVGTAPARFTVTPPAELPEQAQPNMIYPVVATMSDDGGRIAVAHLAAMLRFDPVRHTILLTDNADNGSEVAPIAIRTGAEYRFLTPKPLRKDQQIRDPRDPGATGGKPALFQGVLGDWNQPADVLFVNLPEATVEVDLKSVYRLEHMELGAGSKPNLKGVEICFSRDGKTFSDPKKLDVAGLKLKLAGFELPEQPEARFVRFRLQFSAPEATFGEIKLRGRVIDGGGTK